MAYVQSYFMPNDDQSAPLFTQVWNGFMAERTTMNYKLLDAHLRAMGKDELAAQEKIIRESVREYVKIIQESHDKADEHKVQLANNVISEQTKRQANQNDYRLGLLEQRTKFIEAYKPDETSFNNQLTQILTNRNNFEAQIKKNPKAMERFVKQLANKNYGAKVNTPNDLLFDFNNNMMSEITRVTHGQDDFAKIRYASEKDMLHAAMMGELEETAQRMSDSKMLTEPEKQIFVDVMNELFQQANLGTYDKALTGRARRANANNARQRSHAIVSVDKQSRLEAIEKGRAEFPASETRRAEIKDLISSIHFEYSRWTKPGPPKQPTRMFDGEERNLNYLSAALKESNRYIRGGGGGRADKSDAYLMLIRDIDPVYFANITGYKMKPDDPTQSRRLMTSQAALNNARKDLANISLLRSAKRRFDSDKHPFFGEKKSNYLMENPFKVKGPAYGAMKSLKVELQKMTYLPKEGSEIPSKRYEGLVLGKDYKLDNTTAIGLTKDEDLYIKNLDTDELSIVDSMDPQAQNIETILRQRFMRLTAESAKEARKNE